MIPEHILSKLQPKQGQYSIEVKESFLEKQRRLSEIERQATLQKKHNDMQLFRQTFSSTQSKYSQPGKRIMIKCKGNQAIPLEQYQSNIQTPSVGRRHHLSQSLPRMDPEIKEIKQPPKLEQKVEQQTQYDEVNLVDQQEQIEQVDQQQINEEQQDKSQVNEEQEHIQCLVEQHLSDYQEFVLHLAGKCICVQCPCGKCKCKYEYQPVKPLIAWKSHYNKEFNNKQRDEDLKLNVNLMSRYQGLDLNEYKTTMAADYKSFEIPPQKIKEKYRHRASIGSTPMTSYNKFYMDYGDLHYEQFKQSHYKTVIPELKFTSGTTYASEYRKPLQTETSSAKPPNGKPFPTIDLFLGQSQNKTVHDLKIRDGQIAFKEPQNVQATPAFDKQFVSVTKKDFVGQQIKCIRK